MSETRGDVTDALLAQRDGEQGAFDRLIALVYDDLRRVARRQLRRLRPGNSLDTTGLVHETYLKLVDQRRVDWQDRSHFFGVAARAMRQILVDHARRRTRQKRGGGQEPVQLDEGRVAVEQGAELLTAVDEVLDKLADVDPRLIRVVECRFFAGYSEEETAEILGVSPRTVRRDWSRARAWLRVALQA